MGFFQKFLSLGSRKSKKRRTAETHTAPPLSREEMRRQQQEQEEVASRLLRSSSLRYAVVNEVDYSSLPPLPHPINSLSQTQTQRDPPRRSASIQTRRTYTVTIRDRRVEALTEFPNANPPLDTPRRSSHELANPSSQVPRFPPVTPKDQNRLHMLRQDPSVASLLDMYDNQGRLDSRVFSNTPSAAEKESSKDGRAQVKRGGSTLRQLLGNPESTGRSSTTEGDISWAEGFLREVGRSDIESTASSFYLETPRDLTIGNCVPHGDGLDISSSSDIPQSAHLNVSPAISSMAVELSYTSDENPVLASKRTTEHEIRPAAEVFGFLLEKRCPQNLVTETQLAMPATTRGLESSTSLVCTIPATPSSCKQSPHLGVLQPAGVSPTTNTPSSIGSILADPPHTATILNHTRIPVAHGKLPESSRAGQLTVTAIATRSSRIPRGRSSLQIPSSTLTPTSETNLFSSPPRELLKPTLIPAHDGDVLRSSTNISGRTPAVPSPPPVASKQDVGFAPVQIRHGHRRNASNGSRKPIPNLWSAVADSQGAARVKGLGLDDGKENNTTPINGESVGLNSLGNPKSRLPMTPSRERALFSSAPSPASSSELSPLGQKMMADLRKQRVGRGERRKNRLAEVVTRV